MTAIDRLLANNRARAASFDKGELPSRPALKLAVVACMDARMDLHRILGMEEGDAVVLRNAGGVVTEDVIRSLIVAVRRLGVEEVLLVHHTGCGMVTFTDAEMADELHRDTGVRPAFSFRTFASPEDDVRESEALLEAEPLLPEDLNVRGFVYDVATGLLNEVER